MWDYFFKKLQNTGLVMIQGNELAYYLQVKMSNLPKIRSQCNLIDNLDIQTLKNRRLLYSPTGVRKILNNRGFLLNKKSISLSSIRGNVGKTTIAVQLGKKLSTLGFKTLIIDCDKQADSTRLLCPTLIGKKFPCLLDIIDGTSTVTEAIIKINENLSILPSNLHNEYVASKILNKKINISTFLKENLPISDYDMIIFDTEPNFSLTNLMVLAYSELNIIPIDFDNISLDELVFYQDHINNQKTNTPEINTEIKILFNKLPKFRTAQDLIKMSSIHRAGIDSFFSTIRADNQFTRFEDVQNIKPNSFAYKDIMSFVLELFDQDMPKKQRHDIKNTLTSSRY